MSNEFDSDFGCETDATFMDSGICDLQLFGNLAAIKVLGGQVSRRAVAVVKEQLAGGALEDPDGWVAQMRRVRAELLARPAKKGRLKRS